MAWTTPLSAVANTPLTAGQWNASVRDNMLETTPGVATAKRKIFVTNGTNKIAERDLKDHIVDVEESTTSTSYVDLGTIGPRVTLRTGFSALVWIRCMSSNSGGGTAHMSYAVSGGTTIAAANNKARSADGGSGSWSPASSVTNLETALDSGDEHTFTAKYLSSSVTSSFSRRRIVVLGL